MSPLRARMIEDMILAGLAEGTRQSYVRAVRQLTAFYRRAPDQLSEEDVRRYLLGLRQRGVARGTFQIARYGLQFFYCMPPMAVAMTRTTPTAIPNASRRTIIPRPNASHRRRQTVITTRATQRPG